MAWRSDTAPSAAVDWSKHLDIVDDGLEDDVLPEEDVSPAAGYQQNEVLDEGGSNIFEEISELERERRAFLWNDLGPSLAIDDDEEDLSPPPIPSTTEESENASRSQPVIPSGNIR